MAGLFIIFLIRKQSLGDDDRALTLLQSYLDVASKTQNLGAQVSLFVATACCLTLSSVSVRCLMFPAVGSVS